MSRVKVPARNTQTSFPVSLQIFDEKEQLLKRRIVEAQVTPTKFYFEIEGFLRASDFLQKEMAFGGETHIHVITQRCIQLRKTDLICTVDEFFRREFTLHYHRKY